MHPKRRSSAWAAGARLRARTRPDQYACARHTRAHVGTLFFCRCAARSERPPRAQTRRGKIEVRERNGHIGGPIAHWWALGNETTDRDADRDPRDAKRQTQHMVSHTRSKAVRMANVLRADTMHVAGVHQAAVDVWCVLCTFCLWRHGCCSACMLSLCPCLRSACGSPEDLGDLPSYAAARPTRCPLKRMFMTYT